jgi:hypothetical protein
MTTKTEIKTTQIPDDIKPYIPEIIETLRRALKSDDFTIEITYDNITIKIPDIKVYLFERFMRIMYKDFDIVYSDYVASIKVYKDVYSDPEIYYAHEYWNTLYELHELAKEKVKERLHKILSKF